MLQNSEFRDSKSVHHRRFADNSWKSNYCVYLRGYEKTSNRGR